MLLASLPNRYSGHAEGLTHALTCAQLIQYSAVYRFGIFSMLLIPLIMGIIRDFGMFMCTDCYQVQKNLSDNYMTSPNA